MNDCPSVKITFSLLSHYFSATPRICGVTTDYLQGDIIRDAVVQLDDTIKASRKDF